MAVRRRLGALVAAAASVVTAASLAGTAGAAPAVHSGSAGGGEPTPTWETAGQWNMPQIGHNRLGGGGKMGEGFGELKTADGRRILYAAEESGPGCFSVVDVTVPSKPKLLKQTYVPNEHTRCNSLDIAPGRDLLVVANQVSEPGQKTAGLRIYDISKPAQPRQIGFFDASGPYSRGAHYVWMDDDRYAYLSTGLPNFHPRRAGKDDQIFVILDLLHPAHPRLVSKWWYPGTRVGDKAPLPKPDRIDSGCRAHNTDVFPEQPNRAYVGYIDCGIVVLDISDKAHPKALKLRDDSPPTTGFTHTVMPINGGKDLFVTHEAVQDNCGDAPKDDTIVRNNANLSFISRLPMPSRVTRFCAAGGRFGTHNVYEPESDEAALMSRKIVFTSWFNAGVRAYDVTNPEHPREVAYNVPPVPKASTAPTIQINDVYVDDRGVIFAGDRFGGGLYVFRSPVTRGLTNGH